MPAPACTDSAGDCPNRLYVDSLSIYGGGPPTSSGPWCPSLLAPTWSQNLALICDTGQLELEVRVRADIIGHARINIYVNISHAWFKMADYIRTHRNSCVA